LEILSHDNQRGDGTTIILSKLSKVFAIEDIENRMYQSVPLGVPNFSVFLNNKKLLPLAKEKETKKVGRAVKEAMSRVKEALTRNPNLSPFSIVPEGDPGGSDTASLFKKKESKEEVEIREKATKESEKKATKEKKKIPVVKSLTPNAVVRRMKMGEDGITLCLDHFGVDGAESFTEGGVIYINRDHPLFQRNEKKRDLHILNIARLMTQEISLLKDPHNPREAFDRQSKLLRDAFISD